MIKSCNFTGLFLTGTKLETTEISDLLPLLVNHDHKAFSRLYENYGSVLFGLLIYIVKDEKEAENLLQDTFVKIWKKICDYDATKGAFFSWITSIARNTAIDYLRSKKNIQRLKTQTLEVSVPIKGTENPALELEIKDLKALVKKLEPKYQEVIELVYFLGYTHQEASEQLQIQLGTLKTRSRIGIRELKKFI